MSFWSRVRWRIGGNDPIANRLSDLIQKSIDANSDANEVTSEEITNAIVTIPDKTVMRDHLFRAKLRDITTGINSYLPIDPDLDKLRLWFNNEHGGRYLTDHSFFDNKIQLNGSDQSALLDNTDDDGVSGTGNVNRILFDQYLRVEDNPNVRINNIVATEEGITIYIRVYIEFSKNILLFNRPGVLFSKIDTEQVDYAYSAYLTDDNQIQFFIRHAGREFFLQTEIGAINGNSTNLPDYTELNYSPEDYYTIINLEALPNPIPYTDLVFTYKFSDNRMKIIADGTDILADSTDRLEADIDGWWRMNEGGDIGNTVQNPTIFNKIIYNTVTTGQNGTITGTNYEWFTLDNGSYLRFKGNAIATHVSIPNYTAIQNLTALTVSFWYYPKSLPSGNHRLVSKNWSNNGSFEVHSTSTGSCVFEIKNDAGTQRTTTMASIFPDMDTWYHVVATWEAGSNPTLYVNNIDEINASTLTGQLSTGTTALQIGSITTSEPDGIIHDVKLWNRELSSAEVTTLFNTGHAISYFPKWEANPPLVPPPSAPVSNPFVPIYNVPVPAVAEQDLVKLHQINVTNLEEKYNVADGQTISGNTIPEVNQYQNDPTYSTGSTPVETLSYYNHMSAPTTSSYMDLGSKVGGERFLTGGNVIGKPVMRVVAKMADVNPNSVQATGTIVAKIIRNSDNGVMATSSTVDASTLADKQGGAGTTAWTDATFTFTGNAYNMANNDKIEFAYSGGGGGGGGSPSGTLFSSYAILNQAPGTSLLWSSVGQKAGETWSLGDMVGEIITGIVVKMCDKNWQTTQASGNITVRIVNSSGATQATSSTVNATTLADNQGSVAGGQWTDTTFLFSSNSYVMTNGAGIEIDYNFTGSGSSQVGVAATALSQAPNAIAYHRFTSTVNTYSGRDMIMDVYVQ